jgi:hypothetical protein
VSDREPPAGGDRPSDDEMTGHDVDEPTPDEVERGSAALHELGAEPLPADVLARLDGRLEGELGRPAPVRRRRRLPRLAFALPGAGIALAAVVAVAVLATSGGGSTPRPEATLSMRAKSAAPTLPKAAAGAADSSATPSASAARVVVPDLVGHPVGDARTAIRASGLRLAYVAGTHCPPAPRARVTRQVPAAGTAVAAGTTIRISAGNCS